MNVYISTLKNGDVFHLGACDYLFVGKTTFQNIESYIGCNQDNGKFVGFPADQMVNVPRPKPERTDFWYKRKFIELVYRSTEHHRVEAKFYTICSRLVAAIEKGYGIIENPSQVYCRDDYIITVNYNWKGTTIMLVNTITGKSVACKHIDPKKVNVSNAQYILFDLYKKYMNQ